MLAVGNPRTSGMGIELNARRALLVAGRPLATRELAVWIYHTERPRHWQVGQARMSAMRFCEPVRKLRRPGEPWLWQLKDRRWVD